MLIACLAAASNAVARADERGSVAAASSLVAEPGTPFIGNPQGRDVVVEFFDYRCTPCRVLQPELRRLLREDGEARVVLKEWPLLGGVSLYAARVALAANRQGKFLAVHAGLFASRGPLDRARVRQIAEDAGADVVRLDRDLAARGAEFDHLLVRNWDEATALGLKGPPGLVIGGHVVSGALSFDDLQSLIAEARAKPDESAAR